MRGFYETIAVATKQVSGKQAIGGGPKEDSWAYWLLAVSLSVKSEVVRPTMKEDAFRSWLSNSRGYGIGTVRSRVSNCKTIESHEGDLDQLFEQDKLCGLIDKLAYSKSDEKQNQPARHQIPINGNLYSGTATLRSAVSLYKQFRENCLDGIPMLSASQDRARGPAKIRVAKSEEGRTWSTWEQPDSVAILALAHITVPLIRFLSPDVVHAVVEDNEQHRVEWTKALEERRIDPAAYLWERSPCAFPGVRRYAGSREIAAYRGHGKLDESQNINALALDDNDYPKQIWSFMLRGAKFAKFGPDGFALAHLADHKDHGNRFATDFDLTEVGQSPRRLFGLYTCPSNTVYTPISLIKPTDFVGTIRALLVRRAQELYGSFCEILPPFLRIPQPSSSDWNVSEFKWSDPVGTTKHMEIFLAFRRKRLTELIKRERR
jgi:hypothetical protein